MKQKRLLALWLTSAMLVLNDKAVKHEYACPAGAESLADLPAAYIGTAEFDCLWDGGVLYAERLREFGIVVLESIPSVIDKRTIKWYFALEANLLYGDTKGVRT